LEGEQHRALTVQCSIDIDSYAYTVGVAKAMFAKNFSAGAEGDFFYDVIVNVASDRNWFISPPAAPPADQYDLFTVVRFQSISMIRDSCSHPRDENIFFFFLTRPCDGFLDFT